MANYRKTRIVSQPVRDNINDFASNLDPSKHYIVVHKDGQNAEEDMAMWMPLGYEPARGSEKVRGVPFGTPDNNQDGLKIRGNRILMCCPKDEYLKRKKESYREQESRVGLKSNKKDAQKIVSETGISPSLVSVSVDDDDASPN